MTESYSDSNLDIDPHRWYYTKFSIERYRQEVDWETVKQGFERTARAVRILLNAYQSAGVFGDEELTAIKSAIQVSSAIGVEATQERIQNAAGKQSELDRAMELVAEGTGIVGGIPYPVSTNETSAETLLKTFDILTDDDDAELSEVDAAAERFLDFDLTNLGGATRTPILCLLHPTRFPIVNQQSEKVFDSCFDIELSNDAEDYLDSAEQFRNVRDEFGFDEHLRQLDYYCYWLRNETGLDGSPIPEGLGTRKVWQINAGGSETDKSEHLWPSWQELGICSIGWDIGPLDELSVEEIEAEAKDLADSEAGNCLRRFGKEMEPGQLILAKDGAELLGIGVTQRGGYHYCGEDINQQIEDIDIPHVHVWPVEWQVIPSSELNLDVSEWGLEPSLLPHETPLVGTEAFEGIRWQLARRDPSMITALADLEGIIANPSEGSIPIGCQSQTTTEQSYFILQTGSEKWEDKPTKQYHFVLGHPGTRQLLEAETARVVYLEDGEFYATAQINGIEQEEREDETHVFAYISEYEEINPVSINSVLGDFETQISRQHSISKISANDYRTIVERGTSTRYFWVNSASENWYQEGDTVFYTTTTGSGTPRRNQEVYERMRPGDKVLVYRNAPTQAIVGKAHVEVPLHEESVRGRDEPAEGVTLAWDEQIEEVELSQIESAPEFEGSPIVESGNPYVITELSEEQYETVLGGREPNHFWVTASPAVWDIESTEEGNEVFYTAYNESNRKRRIYSAFESAQPGDHVLFYKSSPAKQIVAEGTIIEGLHEEQPEYREEAVEGITIRYDCTLDPVDWDTLTSLSELEDTTVIRNNARGALFTLSESAYEAIKSAETNGGEDPHMLQERVAELQTKLSPPPMSIELPNDLYFESEDDLRRQIEASLNSGKHIIFTGPPGTGKTKLAKHICEEVVNEYSDVVDDYQFTTATAEWTTFDTIGGYVPNRAEEGDELVFQPRIFLDCFRSEGAVQNEWLVIDEINRSDIDKAFGQLFSVLSGDSVVLPYERDSTVEIVSLDEPEDIELESIITNPDIFPVTPSWRLLATMNTYDKTSLYELSYAFMRRFNFIHVGVPRLAEDGEVRTSLLRPDGDENYATSWIAADDSLREPLSESYKQLAVIWYKVNKHQTIGPSIVHDMLNYLAASGPESWDSPGPALTDAVIALVYPQLEGMAPKDQRNLVESLTDNGVSTEEGDVNLELDGERLERKAEDFFNLPTQSDE